jgi:hypothetical protein
MTNTIKGTAPMRCIVEWDGTSEELIDLVEDTFGELDSPDLGDAMGVLIYECIASHDSEMMIKQGVGDSTLRVTIEYDNFIWEGLD